MRAMTDIASNRSPLASLTARMRGCSASSSDVRHWVDDFSTQLALVAAGEVITLIPRLARPPLREGLVPRPLRRPPQREVHAVWRNSANASPAIQAVLAELGDA